MYSKNNSQSAFYRNLAMYHVPENLITKYAVIGPRYTSYPTAPNWKPIDDVTRDQWFEAQKNSQKPLSLYCHIPFCQKRCFYCGCNAIVTKKQNQSAVYLTYILKELNRLKAFHNDQRRLRQLHLGGGTPNFMLDEELEALFSEIRSLYSFDSDAEIAIEVNPNTIRPSQLDFLRKLGFNRVSFGVQDFDQRVQAAINREQDEAVITGYLKQARALGFQGINFDLIYGLPFQTLESFDATLSKVIDLQPDRLAVYNFGYLPQSMPHQRKIKPETLPDGNLKLAILLRAIERLTDSGYEYIGMDHFARPDDELTVAMKQRTLHRNFMGYTPKSGVDLFGVGLSAISEFDTYFTQNEKDLRVYESLADESGLAAVKGIQLSQDDQIRKWVILRLICHFYLSFTEFKQRFKQEFTSYFADEIERLAGMRADGLLELGEDHIRVIDHGKILVRNICMVFDDYLNQKADRTQYSKTV